jgi:hypothetical protein
MDVTLDRDFLRMLIVQVRAFMAKALEDPDDGSNPTDDPTPELRDDEGDLNRQELIAEIRALDQRQQAELVALMWVGREDAEPEDWDELVQHALDRQEVPTALYLLDHPLLAEDWLAGMERLGLGGLDDSATRVEPSKFRLGDRVRVKRTGEVDYIGEVMDDDPRSGPRYALMQDLGQDLGGSHVKSYLHDDLVLIEPGDAWALAENPNPHRDT